MQCKVVSVQVTDRELFAAVCAGAPKDEVASSGHSSFVADRAEVALRTCSKIDCTSKVEVLSYLGKHFRIVLPYIQEDETDEEVRLSFHDVPCDTATGLTLLSGCI
jgi:hypothetical protein